MLGKHLHTEIFEEDGNYLYALSKREVEKYALGLGLTQVIFKGVNDIYIDGIEEIPLHTQNKIKKKLKLKQKAYDLLSRIGILPYNLLFAVIMKEGISTFDQQLLLKNGYDTKHLPQNPHL